MALVAACAGVTVPAAGLAQATTQQVLSGQELIYGGQFAAARDYFAGLARQHPDDPAPPSLEASALIWWAEAARDDALQADSIDRLLDLAVRRAEGALAHAGDDSARATALFWLGTAHGYRARQADLHGRAWHAVRDARAMHGALERALALDPGCVDCLLGLGIYEYALARASAIARLVARLVGLGGGDVERALAMLRRCATEGRLARTEAQWVYASALLREGAHDPARREAGLHMVGELAQRFPGNPVFARTLENRDGGR